MNKKNSPLFKESLNYISESKNYILLVTFIFIASFLLGFILSEYLTFFDEIIKELIDKTEGLTGISLISFIFFNNLSSAFIGMVLGIFVGIVPVINAFTNGAVVGYVYSKISSIEGFGVFWRLLPHGIFELPAIFISLGLGIKLGMFILAKEKKKSFFIRLKKSLIAFILVVIPLLITAAIIEGLLIDNFSG